MADNGATTRRSLSSTITYTEPTNSATPRSATGEAYSVLGIFTTVPTNDTLSVSGRTRPAETLYAAGAGNILVSPDRGIYFQTALTPDTEKGRVHSARLATTFTEVGSEEISSVNASSETTLLFKRDSLPVTITRYHLACYDSAGVRHYWVDFSVSFANAPALSVGITYNVSKFIILAIF